MPRPPTKHSEARKAARDAGEPLFYYDVPCSQGHDTGFYTKSGACKTCVIDRNVEAVRIARVANREKFRQRNRVYLGMPEPTRARPDVCECCGLPSANRALAVDHCHITNQFRGWLCLKCNTAIGKLGDSILGLQNALDYLLRFHNIGILDMNAPATLDNSVLFAPGRFVQGDMYKPNEKDMKGQPLLIKSGPNAGQPRVEYFFKVAIPKTKPNWWLESWGEKVLALANGYWPQGQTTNPKFAWKIEDGDDATPNFERGGRKNCEIEGFAGCWVVKFSSGFATKIYDAAGNPLLQEGLVKRGYWVEVLGTVNSNSDATKSGIHINHNLVAYRGMDKEITSGPDPRAVGFGQAPLPPGVTGAPVGTANMPSQAVPGGAPAVPATPATPAARTPAPSATPTAPAAAPTPVAPSGTFMAPPVPGAQAPVAPTAPAAPAAPPVVHADPLGAPAGYRMANPAGARYEGFTANGWTIDAMVQAGHMVRL